MILHMGLELIISIHQQDIAVDLKNYYLMRFITIHQDGVLTMIMLLVIIYQEEHKISKAII